MPPSGDIDDAFKHLGAYSSSVATFFTRRLELEAAHLAELEKLLLKQDESDRRLDASLRDLGITAAWSQIKSTVHAELVERRQGLYKLQHSCIEPLVSFRDQRERQRKRIKEETATITSEHGDYKAHTLRLKRQYQRKSEEVKNLTEMHYSQPAHSASTATAAGGGSGSGSGLGAFAGGSATSPTSSNGSGSQVHGHGHSGLQEGRDGGAAQSDGRPSSSQGPSHSGASNPGAGGGFSTDARSLVSGATSTSLRDAQSPPPRDNAAIFAIKHSRSQLNSLIHKLSTSTAKVAGSAQPATAGSGSGSGSGGAGDASFPAGGGSGGGGASGRYPSAATQSRLSRVKREAEEADAQYRSALHHLETLRLQKERIANASMGSLTEFAFEFSNCCRSVFAQYCDSWASKARQTEKLCEVAKQASIGISPQADVAIFTRAIAIGPFFEEPLPYENYHVGTSYSLIFGVSLNEYTNGNDGVLVPLTVQRAIMEVDARGLEIEGIYRISGKLNAVQQVVQEIEQDEITFEFAPERHDVHTVSAVLRLYLRQLPEALFPIDSAERMHISKLISSSEDPGLTSVDPKESEAYKLVSKKLRRMSPSHQATAKMLIAHFARVLARQDINKMNVQALTLCLNPCLFPEETNLGAFTHGHKDRVLEYLIAYRQELFAGLPISEEARNNPSRRSRLSGGSSGFRPALDGADVENDDDDDPPYRRSQENIRAPIVGAATKAAADAVPEHTSSSAQNSDPSLAAGAAPSPSMSHRTSPLAVKEDAATETLSPTASETGYDTVSTADLAAFGLGSPPLPGMTLPKRTLSQRARSSSQQLANAMKTGLNLGRSRSGSNSHSQVATPGLPSYPFQYQGVGAGGPIGPLSPPMPGTASRPLTPLRNAEGQLVTTRPPAEEASRAVHESGETLGSKAAAELGLSPAQQMLQQRRFMGSPPPPPTHVPALSPHPLPAGAAPLLDRPPSFSGSISTSSPPTPGHSGYLPQGAHPYSSHERASRSSLGLAAAKEPVPSSAASPDIDPDSVYENYHNAAG